MSKELMHQNTPTLVRTEIDTQIATAKMYPRNIENFVKKATYLATLSEETAESCIYCLYRKSSEGAPTEVKGPSIRLAEIAATSWGNIHAAARIAENDGRTITAEGVAWDLESNVRVSVQVKRSIETKSGKTYGTEMQVVTGNAACAVALRNAIFKVVPKALVDCVYAATVKFAVGDQKTLKEKRAKIFNKFKISGIEPERIFTFFNKQKIEDFDAKDIEVLIGIGTAISQQELKIDEAFLITEDTSSLSANERVKELLAKKP